MKPGPLLVGFVFIATIFGGCVGDPAAKDLTDDAPLVKRGKSINPGAPVPACAYRFDGSFSEVCTEGPYKEKPFVRVYVPSKLDGADIEIGYWLPDVPAGEKVPVIVSASPYYGSAGTPAMNKKPGSLLRLASNYIEHGYAVAGVSVRGTGESGGCMDLMGKKELADLDQAITWLGDQPWSSGSIGMIGVSYDGSTPWSVAAMGNKYLKTIIPISGVPDVWGLMFRNGSAESRGPFLLNLLYYGFFARTDPQVSEKVALHTVQGIVCPESWVGLGAAAYAGVAGGRDPAGWWAERNRKPLVEKNYKGSILSIQGLQDWNVDPSQVVPWVDQLNKTGVPTYQLLGQWGHNNPDGSRTVPKDRSPHRWDWAQILLNWMDYWLKDQTSIQLGPQVQIQDSNFEWHYMDSFPPRGANWSTMHLSNGQALAREPGAQGSVLLTPAALLSGTGAAQYFRSLPGYAADFTTPPLTEDMWISGLPRLHVTVQPKGPSGSLGGYLYSVDPSGAEKRIGWTSINLLYADGTETMKPITPNANLLAKMQMEPMDAHLKAGDRLRVRVWEQPDSDRVPAVPPQPIELFWGGSVKSTIELPLIDGDQTTYFKPPFPN
jgi:predicted acyl esterase